MDADRGDVDEREIKVEVGEYVARAHSTYTPLANVPPHLSEDANPKPWWDTPNGRIAIAFVYFFPYLHDITILISGSVPFYFMAEDLARYTLDTSAILLALVTLSLVYFLFDTDDAPTIFVFPAAYVLLGAVLYALYNTTVWIEHHTPRPLVLGAVLGCFKFHDLPPPLRAEIIKILIHITSLYGLYMLLTRYAMSLAWLICGSVLVRMFPWRVVLGTASKYLARPIGMWVLDCTGVM